MVKIMEKKNSMGEHNANKPRLRAPNIHAQSIKKTSPTPQRASYQVAGEQSFLAAG